MIFKCQTVQREGESSERTAAFIQGSYSKCDAAPSESGRGGVRRRTAKQGKWFKCLYIIVGIAVTLMWLRKHDSFKTNVELEEERQKNQSQCLSANTADITTQSWPISSLKRFMLQEYRRDWRQKTGVGARKEKKKCHFLSFFYIFFKRTSQLAARGDKTYRQRHRYVLGQSVALVSVSCVTMASVQTNSFYWDLCWFSQWLSLFLNASTSSFFSIFLKSLIRRSKVTVSHWGRGFHHQFIIEFLLRVMKKTWLLPPERTDAKKTCRRSRRRQCP